MLMKREQRLRTIIAYEWRFGGEANIDKLLEKIGTSIEKECRCLGLQREDVLRLYETFSNNINDAKMRGVFYCQPMVGISVQTMLDYLYNKKSDEDWLMLLLWLAVKSLSKATVFDTNTNGNHIVARMAGYKSYPDMMKNANDVDSRIMGLIEDGKTGSTARHRRRRLFDKLESTYQRVFFISGYKSVRVIRTLKKFKKEEIVRALELAVKSGVFETGCP